MRNLKRALSLVLAVVMVIGLMVVGASAVSYNDFSDRGEIVNKDAVSMLTTLGIIEGKPDGSYAPTEGVDRAQMAKMISVIMNQGADNSALYVNSPTGLTDIATNWAKGHINYCYTLGIIAGRGNGTFDPSAGVTGVEAAKMLLVAAGYDPKIEGFEGSDWAINVNAKASALGIFRNFTKDVNAPLNRDDAALLIYNTMDVEMIQQYQNGYALTYLDHRTILSSVFGVIRVEGVVVANEWAQLQETDSDAALREGRTTLDNVVWYDSTTSNTVVDEGVRETDPVTFNVTTPVEFMGQAVTMYVEKTTILSNSKVIGVATNDELNVIYASANGDETDEDALDGTNITVGRDTEYYVNYGYCEDADEAIELVNDFELNSNTDDFNLNGVEVQVIDNDDDGIAEYVLYLRETLSQVIRYNTRDEVVSFYESNVGADGLYDNDNPVAVRVDFEDTVIAEGDELSADDLILYVEYGGRTYIKLADIVTGTMTRLDRNRAGELYITIDNGDEYYESFIRDEASEVDVDIDNFDIDDPATRTDAPGFDTLFDFILDSNGFIVAIRPAEEVVVNYALVLDSAWTQNALRRSGEIEILAADGTDGTYTIDWDASVDALENIDMTRTVEGAGGVPEEVAIVDADEKLETYLGTRDVNVEGRPGQTYNDTGLAAGSLITYSLDEDNVLTIESILQQNSHNDPSSLEIDNNDPTDTAGVGNNRRIVYMETGATINADGTINYAANHNGDNNHHVQYSVVGGYTNGTGSITIEGGVPWFQNEGTKTYAVDRNTVAFYYYGNGSAEVLTGWDEMSSVPAGTHVQIYPVLTKTNNNRYEASNLAGVILFEAPTQANDDDYLLVLNRNAYTGSNDLWLNVVFEDGTVAEIEVDNYNGRGVNGNRDFDSDEDFMKAYSYVVNSDGTYDLADANEEVVYQNKDVNNDNQGNVEDVLLADLLRVGTVAYGWYVSDDGEPFVNANNNYVPVVDAVEDEDEWYIAYVQDEANVWDVTGVTNASDEVSAGDFRQNVEVHAVIVNDNDAIRTAWIWDVEEAANVAPVENEDYYLNGSVAATDNGTTITVNAALLNADDNTGVVNETVDYSWSVEILAANGTWVEATNGDGRGTTDQNGAIDNIVINFVTAGRANSYRVVVTFENSNIGTVTEILPGA